MSFTHLRRHPLALLLLAATLALGAGCKSIPTLDTIEFMGQDVPTVGLYSAQADCNAIYPLTRDCSDTLGAQRPIMVSGHELRIAGSEDGYAILIMRTERLDVDSDDMRMLGRRVVNRLSSYGIEVVEITAVALLADVFGFYLLCDGDAWTALTTDAERIAPDMES